MTELKTWLGKCSPSGFSNAEHIILWVIAVVFIAIVVINKSQ